MKRFFARMSGVVILGAALAACSGGQGITPSTPGTTPLQGAAVSAPSHDGFLRVTGADFAMARQFKAMGSPHITYTVQKNPYKNFARSHAAPVGYPLDMTCQTSNCPVMSKVVSYNIYVNSKNQTPWGNPEDFEKGLTGSPLAGLITQYSGGNASAYTYGGSVGVNYSLPYSTTFYNNDLYSILAAGAGHFKALGLNVQYHIFLPKGIDTCFDQTGICYSPDNLSSFYFCAYHSAVLFNGQPIVYSVEPYQNAKVQVGSQSFWACQNAQVPHGTNRLNSGTASTLSHEMFESWSDPIPNTGWFNSRYNMEIGDVCAYQYMDKVKFGKNSWYVQQEYSNSAHGCASN